MRLKLSLFSLVDPAISVYRPYERLSIIVLISTILLLNGCLRSQAETEVAATLPLDDSLPQSWEPLRPVQPINLDGDAAPEYLLFFTYDGSNGPVGAVIYDNRLGDTIGGVGDESNRPSASLMPYPILPSYRTDGGQGFIAEPTQKDAVAVYPLQVRASDTADEATADNPDASATTAQTDLLAILGGTTYVTFVWWQPTQNSYGITQLYTPDRFEIRKFQPFPWESWRETPSLITEIITVHPVRDRNLLCFRRRHTLVAPDLETLAPEAPIDTIVYHETNLGLDFCSGTPPTPFYPEGVVLAYLLGNSTLLDATLEEGVRQSIQATAVPQEIVYVKDLASYKTIRNLSGENAEVQVCAEVLRPGTFYITDETTVAANDQGNAIISNPPDPNNPPPHALQWLLFTLRHVPFQLDPPPPQPDRLFITNVRKLAAPTRSVPLECRVQLGDYSQ